MLFFANTRGKHGASLHRIPDAHAMLRFHENCWFQQKILTILPLCLRYVFFFAINFVELTFFVFVYVVLHFAVLSFSCVCVQVMNKKYWYLLYTSIP